MHGKHFMESSHRRTPIMALALTMCIAGLTLQIHNKETTLQKQDSLRQEVIPQSQNALETTTQSGNSNGEQDEQNKFLKEHTDMQTVSGVNFISDNSIPEVYMGVINFGASDIILPNGYGAQTMQISDSVTSQVVTKASDKVVRIQSFTVSTNYITTVSKNDAVPDDIFIEACNGISSSLLGVSVNSVSSCKVEAGKFAKADIPIKDDGTNTVHAYYTMPAKDDKLYILLIQDNKNSRQDDAIAVVKNGFFLRTAYEE